MKNWIEPVWTGIQFSCTAWLLNHPIIISENMILDGGFSTPTGWGQGMGVFLLQPAGGKGFSRPAKAVQLEQRYLLLYVFSCQI